MNLFETSLPLRLDYEATLAYLLLPPAGGVLLLVMEHKSDYVRYAIGYKRDMWTRSWLWKTGTIPFTCFLLPYRLLQIVLSLDEH